MAKYFKSWVSVVLWLLIVAGFGAAYVAGQITVGTLVFSEVCALTLGVIALIFGRRMGHPPETVEQILYKTEHPTRP
jgi:hypothetical protein